MYIRGFVIQGGIGDLISRARGGRVARWNVGMSDGAREFFESDTVAGET
jgi:pantoate kinase